MDPIDRIASLERLALLLNESSKRERKLIAHLSYNSAKRFKENNGARVLTVPFISDYFSLRKELEGLGYLSDRGELDHDILPAINAAHKAFIDNLPEKYK